MHPAIEWDSRLGGAARARDLDRLARRETVSRIYSKAVKDNGDA